MTYASMLGDMLSQIYKSGRVYTGNYNDFQHESNRELPEMDETICQACGEPLETRSENVGFNEPGAEKIEIEWFCANGCIQDEGVTIL